MNKGTTERMDGSWSCIHEDTPGQEIGYQKQEEIKKESRGGSVTAQPDDLLAGQRAGEIRQRPPRREQRRLLLACVVQEELALAEPGDRLVELGNIRVASRRL